MIIPILLLALSIVACSDKGTLSGPVNEKKEVNTDVEGNADTDVVGSDGKESDSNNSNDNENTLEDNNRSDDVTADHNEGTEPDPYAIAIEDANRCLDEGNYEGAVEKYEEAAALVSDRSEIDENIVRAVILLSEKELQEKGIEEAIYLLQTEEDKYSANETVFNSLEERKNYYNNSIYLESILSKHSADYWVKESYDKNGNLLSREYSSGTIENYKYDENNRVIYYYHDDTNDINRLAVPWVYSYTKEYDENGNMIREIETSDIGTDYESEEVTIYEYDDQNRLIHQAGGSEYFKEYYYIYDGNWKYINEYFNGNESWEKYLYDDDGNELYFENSYESWCSKTYNEYGISKSESYSGIQCTKDIRTYQYDDQGNLLSITDDNELSIDGPITTYYEYDDQGRKIAERTGTSTYQYEYDKYGNMIYEKYKNVGDDWDNEWEISISNTYAFECELLSGDVYSNTFITSHSE